MPNLPNPGGLIGRAAEVAVLQQVADTAKAGRSAAIVVHGDAGIGKTSLVESVDVHGLQVLRVTGVESETTFPGAGLHQLRGELADGPDHLPEPQRIAVETTLGLRAGPPPSPFLVGLAVLGLLSDQAAKGPLICLVDDAHWLDEVSRQALTFAARRLGPEGVAVVFVTRHTGPDFAGLPRLELGGLDDRAARALLGTVLPGPVDERVLDQLLGEAAGNPLALRVLPRALLPTEMAGRAVPLSARIERSLLTLLAPLSAPAHRLVLLAAAEPTGDVPLLWRAIRALGLDAGTVEAVERSGALSIGTHVRFSHPLIRSAVYGSAPPSELRRVHAALAEAGGDDEDRRTWHRGLATLEPDEDIAAALAESARRAQSRGGVAATAALFERSAALSPEPGDRARRLLAAAGARLDSGAPEAARTLLNSVHTAVLEPRDSVLARHLRVRVDHAVSRAPAVAYDLIAVARDLSDLDADLARGIRIEALFTAVFAAGLRGNPEHGRALWADISRAVLADVDPSSRHPVDLLIRGDALAGAGDRAAALPLLRQAVAGLLDGPADLVAPQWAGLECHSAIAVWDHAALARLADRQVAAGRERGLLTSLPTALSFAGTARLVEGRLDEAAAIAAEIEVIKEATGHPFPRHIRIQTAAWQGDAVTTGEIAAEFRRDAEERGDGSVLSIANYAEAILANGAGRHADAVTAGAAELDHVADGNFSSRILGELVEAAARTGQRQLTETALAALTRLTEPVGGDWALGVLAAARALAGGAGPAAEDHHREAIERFERAGLAAFQGRARLAYGEWLRRARRRVDARAQLRTAHRLLADRGAAGFAGRAARELEATGESARARTVHAGDTLTAQELTIARLARDGLTNRDIATRLFISVRTVEYHLFKAFPKLGIRSRQELAEALEPSPPRG